MDDAICRIFPLEARQLGARLLALAVLQKPGELREVIVESRIDTVVRKSDDLNHRDRILLALDPYLADFALDVISMRCAHDRFSANQQMRTEFSRKSFEAR